MEGFLAGYNRDPNRRHYLLKKRGKVLLWFEVRTDVSEKKIGIAIVGELTNDVAEVNKGGCKCDNNIVTIIKLQTKAVGTWQRDTLKALISYSFDYYFFHARILVMSRPNPRSTSSKFLPLQNPHLNMHMQSETRFIYKNTICQFQIAL